MILSLIRSLNNGAELRDILPGILFTVIVVLLSLSLHEMSHGFAAYKLGDPTARNMGRLTLNPAKHLDPIGTISMMLVGFGWAKPVPINSRYFKNPRRDIAICSLAGPFSNLCVSFIALILFYVVIVIISPTFGFFFDLVPRAATPFYFSPSNVFDLFASFNLDISLADKMLVFLAEFLAVFHILNLYLALFNLIPIPPLDGSKILYMFLPPNIYFKIQQYEQMISLVLIVLLLTGSISGFLSDAALGISNGMSWLIKLIPGL